VLNFSELRFDLQLQYESVVRSVHYSFLFLCMGFGD
jgi:hypothetical protein